MLRFENVATPATAFATAVPLSVPLDGLFPMAMVTWLVAVGTTLPAASSILATIDGVMELPAPTLLGPTVNTTFAAAPTRILNALLVAPVSPVALADSV